MRIRILPPSLLALALAACASGPDYKPPAVPPSATGSFTMAQGTVMTDRAPADRWWTLYNDPVLDGLIGDALKANTDIRVALARLDRARADLREAKADRLPRTDIGVSTNRQRIPAVQALPGYARDNTYVDAGLSVAYEVDLFGRVRREVQAARGHYEAAEADVDAMRVAVVADTTKAYVDAASAAQRLKVAERIVSLLDRTLGVTKARQKAGLAGMLDVARISALREQRVAEMPAIAAERQAALFRLAILTGRTPAELPDDAGARTQVPVVEEAIPIGDGMQLLARRPDVRAAERRLAAATARIGVATADLYPKVSIGASVGSTAYGFGDYFGQGPLRWMLGPLLSWSFPNQAHVRAAIDRSRADTREALATFDGTVLQALGETETALSNYARELDRRKALGTARDEAERAVTIVRAQQREGQVDSLSLLDVERTFAEAEAELAGAEGRVADRQVDLFQALGGGWASWQNASATNGHADTMTMVSDISR
ncbi:MAG: Solvent efflux pump outer membrane protein SrpC [Luteibacter sp.]|uniref:efflux transporter outer membrane subunit n=1 Tax=Luteibacter sp. TaxID=1886636 RepID=UPI0013816B82|nr:TolC family protein [Luteibacter sp.]KAF1007233.1 MAG: Solvent efflux pump outer membrane protein SrpC [Luteibacter sp.]